MAIRTVRYQFTKDTGSAIDAFEGLNQEADGVLNEALEEGYAVVLQEVVPPSSDRHNYVVIVKLWKSDVSIVQRVELAADLSSFEHQLQRTQKALAASGVNPDVVEQGTAISDFHGDGIAVDHADAVLTHEWQMEDTEGAAILLNEEPEAPISTPRIVRKASAKAKPRTTRKSK